MLDEYRVSLSGDEEAGDKVPSAVTVYGLALVGLLLVGLLAFGGVAAYWSAKETHPPGAEAVRPFPPGAVLLDERTDCSGGSGLQVCDRSVTLDLGSDDALDVAIDHYRGTEVTVLPAGDSMPSVVLVTARRCSEQPESGICP